MLLHLAPSCRHDCYRRCAVMQSRRATRLLLNMQAPATMATTFPHVFSLHERHPCPRAALNFAPLLSGDVRRVSRHFCAASNAADELKANEQRKRAGQLSAGPARVRHERLPRNALGFSCGSAASAMCFPKGDCAPRRVLSLHRRRRRQPTRSPVGHRQSVEVGMRILATRSGAK